MEEIGFELSQLAQSLSPLLTHFSLCLCGQNENCCKYTFMEVNNYITGWLLATVSSYLGYTLY
jgi:hypothetical protein